MQLCLYRAVDNCQALTVTCMSQGVTLGRVCTGPILDVAVHEMALSACFLPSLATLQRTYPLPPSKILEKVGVNEHTSDSQCQNLDLPVSYRFASHEMVRSSQ